MNKILNEKVSKRIDEIILNLNGFRKKSISFDIDGTYTLVFSTAKTNTINLLDFIGKKEFISQVKKFYPTSTDVQELIGILMGLKNDINAGMLDDMNSMIEANISGDYLTQAEELLLEGKTGNYDHVPAAVLVGAILEDALRRLCQRQKPSIHIKKSNGKPKTMNDLIEDLKKAGLFNELKAKQLRAWVDIRNAAAHGRFEDFNRKDTEEMLKGVQNFLADFM